MHRRIHTVFAASAMTALLLGSTVATAGMSGAIFTTNADGTWVNGNVYDSADDVYLNGGPRANQNCSAAGLPDGDYYFQVTDPPGKVRLSEDVLKERRIRVAAGVIKEYLGSTHQTSVGPCDLPTRPNITVQLMPFMDPANPNPNPGGEFKAWLTPVGNSDCDNAYVCAGLFLSSNSKTDNFKVQPPDQPDSGGGD